MVDWKKDEIEYNIIERNCSDFHWLRNCKLFNKKNQKEALKIEWDEKLIDDVEL